MQENLIELFEKFKLEIIIGVCCAVSITLALVSLYIYDKHVQGLIRSQMPHEAPAVEAEVVEKKEVQRYIAVDISGAVRHPGGYSLIDGARLEDAVKKAGGLSESAERDFYARNFNLSKRLADQEKIYIPRRDEVENGTFVEGRYIIDGGLAQDSTQERERGATAGLISINSASKDELDSLPGVGEVTVGKIIDGRPYGALEELIQKKILGEKTFTDLKSLITLE